MKTATDPQFEGYSGFQDDGGKKTELDKILKKDRISKVVVYGIATDYCVRATALDAVAAGYQVTRDQKPVPGSCSGYHSKGP